MLSEDDIKFLRRFMEAREEKDATELAAKRAKERYQEMEADLYERLADGPVSRLNNVDLGAPWGKVSFGARETFYGRVIDEDAALAHFEQRAMLDEVSHPKFTMKRINELVRDSIEQGQSPPPGLDFYARRGVTVTRQKD
jgi:hypothetical protein